MFEELLDMEAEEREEALEYMEEFSEYISIGNGDYTYDDNGRLIFTDE